ncbi:MAG: glycoside hydrolase family 43 protein, partial [Planctomycetota bacterium]
MQIVNPVIPGFAPDPSICRVADDYYLAVSSFEYFPAIPIFHSRDLVHWHRIGHAVHRPEQMTFEPWVSCGMQAPTLRHHDGRFWLTCTNGGGGGNFIVHAEDPAGPWSDPLWIDQAGIDPDIFVDVDGSVYYTNSWRFTDAQGRKRCTIGQSRIDLTTGQRLEPVREIWEGTGGKGAEAPHIYHIDGHYYLLIAEGGTEYGHMVTIARSDRIEGPYSPCPRNPILSHRSLASPIQCTGHADLIDTQDDNWFMVFLATRPVGYPPCYHLGRETFLAPVCWDDDGWPVVGDDGTVALEMEADLPAGQEPWKVPASDDFDAEELGLCWNFLRNPRDRDWSLTERPGWLRLHGSTATLDQEQSPAWIGRRQQHFNCSFRAKLDFSPEAPNEEAGLCVLMNSRHHYEIAVTGAANRRRLVLRRRVGSLQLITA